MKGLNQVGEGLIAACEIGQSTSFFLGNSVGYVREQGMVMKFSPSPSTVNSHASQNTLVRGKDFLSLQIYQILIILLWLLSDKWC